MPRLTFAAFLLFATTLPLDTQSLPPFQVEEATIAEIHDALKAGRVTCRALVEQYLRRIEAYDKNGPAINAIVMTNPEALRRRDDLDRRAAQGGFAGPLHCVPMIVKDNFETIGSAELERLAHASRATSPATDAFQVERIKAAGAIVLAKSNLAEWAFTPNETLSSILPGYTKNPYALDRVTAGSSGGTAASVAASFGAVGPRLRHRQLDSRAVVASGAGRHPLDDGADEPRRRVAAQPAGRHRRADGPHVADAAARIPGGRRRGPGRSGDGRRARARDAGVLRRGAEARRAARACASACCARRTSATRPIRRSCRCS